MKKHIKNVHNPGDELHKCDICSKTFNLPNKLKKHINHMHGNKNKSKQNCDSCGKSFLKRSQLRVHEEMEALTQKMGLIPFSKKLNQNPEACH